MFWQYFFFIVIPGFCIIATVAVVVCDILLYRIFKALKNIERRDRGLQP